MVLLNGISRYLCIEACRRTALPPDRTRALAVERPAMIERSTAYARAHLEDMPEVRPWVWGR